MNPVCAQKPSRRARMGLFSSAPLPPTCCRDWTLSWAGSNTSHRRCDREAWARLRNLHAHPKIQFSLIMIAAIEEPTKGRTTTTTTPAFSAQEAAITNGKKILHGTATDRVLRILETIRSGGPP